METARNHEEEKMRVLYEASYKGCVSILNTLIQQDPLLLHKISSRTIFTETPLHISALLGHLAFTKALLTHKPELALELDFFQSTPLHMASAEGRINIVKELLLACDEACLVRDQEGRIPLHYAVIRARLEVVTELIRAKPESLRILDKGKTIFHLCVMHNHLEILNALVDSDVDDTYELLNERDMDGKNTILHLAVMLKQVETVRYLISIPKIREASDLENGMGYSAHDILQRNPQDFKSLEIQIILMNCGIESGKKEMNTDPEVPTITNIVGQEMKPDMICWTKFFKSMEKWITYNGDWLEDMRGNLSLVATVISTITFEAGSNPPGGIIQQGVLTSSNGNPNDLNPTPIQNGSLGCLPFMVYGNRHNYNGTACPGEAMLASQYPVSFRNFVIYNSISFVTSVGVILLLVSGVPLKNKFVMLLLSILMCITITFLALSYFVSLAAVTPDQLWWEMGDKVYVIAQWTWAGLLGLVVLYITAHLVVWVVKKFKKIIKHQMLMCPRIREGNCCNCFI